ncbi:flavohemoglobin expression-modulating QEGLA motif protein [Haloferula chungangensis]|uniref:Flavohemoglobin expression-modulating QEGLA motif protein n=1 Tax=Haloferula chungangensis TaxID=1048331 RepID=A0ABW2L1K5_9BACT
MNESKIRELDKALIEASKGIRVLKALAWPAGTEADFIKGWSCGNPRLPDVQIQGPNLSSNIEALDAIAAQADPGHPVGIFLRETAMSYADAGRMLESVGTPDFTRYSIQIYGRPDRQYKNQQVSPVDGAKFFLSVTDDLLGNPQFPTTVAKISDEDFAKWLRAEMDEFFTDDEVKVVLDPDMSSKALAGSKRIRLRAGAVFSQLDKDQLLHHEAFVHTATQLNGKKQKNLRSLGLGAPRTTRTQEGIAVLAELITGSIDISRLRRVALRVIAVTMALEGADFIEVFRFFLDAGQTVEESVRSTQRIFRSGDVHGGIVFTKDAVYLQGLIEVHTFMRLAIRDNRSNLIHSLFAGRLTLADSLRLDRMFESGWLIQPAYIPGWASDSMRLAAMMAYSAFMTNIQIDNLKLERAIEFEEELRMA